MLKVIVSIRDRGDPKDADGNAVNNLKAQSNRPINERD
jgi:hypothetical protein